MELKIGIDKAAIKRIERELAAIPGGATKAMATSLNRAVRGVTVDAAKAIAKVYYVKQGDVKAAMRSPVLATRQTLEAKARIEGKAIRLIKFGAYRTRRGIRVGVKRGGRSVWRYAFFANFKAGEDTHVGVFTRDPSAKPRKSAPGKYNTWGITTLPIKQRFGPAIPSMVKDAGAFEAIQAGADARLKKNLDHEVERLLKGYGS